MTARLVFFGGKGGVGKTTLACAAAHLLALRGRRTLLVSTDPAHSVGDVLGVAVGPRPRRVSDGLDAVELDLEAEAARRVRAVKDRAAKLLPPDIYDAFARYLDAVGRGPGAEEYALVERIGEFHASGYDYVVFDTSPIGHTLRLLQLPELLGHWIEALRRQRAAFNRLASHVARLVGGRAGEDPLMGFLEERATAMGRIASLLRDPTTTSFFLVANPEKVVLDETARFLARLREVGVPVKGIIMNRVGGPCGGSKAQLERAVREFGDLIVAYVDALPEDPYGLDRIGEVGRRIGRVLEIVDG